MSKAFPKRFYTSVAVARHDGGYAVTLDDRPVKTPGKLPLVMARKDHAVFVANEWDAVMDHINPADMPLTRLMNVAVERTPQNRDELIAEARRYGETDLLCYRAENPQGLVDQQNAQWTPWLEWAKALGIDLQTTDSLIAITQEDAALNKIAEMASVMDDVSLTLLVHFTAVYGSVILALAVMNGTLETGQGFDISRLDSRYQAEHWGEDEEAAEIAAATRAETVVLGQLI